MNPILALARWFEAHDHRTLAQDACRDCGGRDLTDTNRGVYCGDCHKTVFTIVAR